MPKVVKNKPRRMRQNEYVFLPFKLLQSDGLMQGLDSLNQLFRTQQIDAITLECISENILATAQAHNVPVVFGSQFVIKWFIPQ